MQKRAENNVILIMDLYFDNAATTRLSEKALEAYIKTEREFFANPSSVHRDGIKARKELERIRESIASAMSIPPSSLFFTSGATESIATVFSSLLFNEPGRIIISSIEHEAVSSWLPILKHHGWDTVVLKAKGGKADPEELRALLTPDTKLVAVMAVNNVTGAREDIKELVRTVREYERQGNRRIFFFSDSVQALGKVPYDIQELGIDGASFSGHKINGPRGIGMLYLKNPASFRPLAPAGGQERGKRGGTENLPAIAALEQAVLSWLGSFGSEYGRISGINQEMRKALEDLGMEILSPEDSSPYIISFVSPLPSEVYVRMLSDKGIAASSGSACSNNSKGEGEKILLSMGIRSSKARNAVRISFSGDTDSESADAFIKAVKEISNGE